MAIDIVSDFLTKQILIEKKVVTYRSLSRGLDLHVNDAKNALASFREIHANDMPSMHATLLVSGTVASIPALRTKGIGNWANPTQDTMDEVLISRFRVSVVEEQELEATLSGGIFQEISSVHIYSLSGTRIIDPSILTAPTDFIREKDNCYTTGTNTVGRVIGPEAQTDKPAPVKSRKPQVVDTKPPTVLDEQIKKQEPLKKSGSLQGFLGSKGQVAGIKENQKNDKSQHSTAKGSFFTPRPKTDAKSVEHQAPKTETKVTGRGMKIRDSGELEEAPKPARLQKRTVLSDEEPDEQPKRLGKKRKSIVDEDTAEERSLKAIMDIDDDAVSRASRVKGENGPPGIEKSVQQKQEEKLEEEDIAQNTEEEQHTKGQYIDKKPRKQRKQNSKQKDIPVDCNGQQKRKVTKSRKEKDKKGRTITVDYSSWESASEEEGSTQPELSNNAQVESDKITKPKVKNTSGTTRPKPLAKNPSTSSDLRGYFTLK